MADITFFTEPLGDSSDLVDVGDEQLPGAFPRFFGMSLIFGRPCRVVACDPVLVRVETGRKRHQGRTTEGSWDIPTLEKRTLRRELIEMRRLNVGVPHEAVISVAVIVG